MVSMKFFLISTDNANRETKTKNLGNCIRGYAGLAPYGTAAELPYKGSSRYESYADWADAVGRAINELTTNSYVDSQVAATWAMSEELM